MLVDICLMFHEDTLKGFQVTERTRFCDGQTNGRTDSVTHGSTVARTVMCRQDGRGRNPVLLDDLSKCRTHSQRKSKLS